MVLRGASRIAGFGERWIGEALLTLFPLADEDSGFVGLDGVVSKWPLERDADGSLEREAGRGTAWTRGADESCSWKRLSENLVSDEGLAPIRCVGSWLVAISASLSPVRSMRSIAAAPARFNQQSETRLELIMAHEAAEGFSYGSPNIDRPQGCGSAMMGLRLAKPFVDYKQILPSLRLSARGDFDSKVRSPTLVTLLRAVIPNNLRRSRDDQAVCSPGSVWAYTVGWKERLVSKWAH